MNIDTTGVDTSTIPFIWDSIHPLIEQALAYSDGEYNAGDIYSLLMYQRMQLWIAATDDELIGMVITEINEYPRKKIGSMVLVAGLGLDDWEFIFPEIEQWMYEQGVDSVRNLGRVGWRRGAKRHGYEAAYCVYSKPLRIDHADSH